MTQGQALEELARWQQLLKTGDLLLAQLSTAAQHDLVIASVSQILDCRADLCFLQQVYHLPGDEAHSLYNPASASPLMQRAVATHQIEGSPTGQEPAFAVPLICDDVFLGILEVTRPADHPFTSSEQGFLQVIADHLAAILMVTHQVAIKNFRLEQISLVRSVSSRIANILDLDELARQVVRLIQNTYQYYYVGIFTLEPRQETLQFRANAVSSQDENARAVSLPPYPVHLGEGIVGSVALTGEEILAPDVQQEPRYRYVDALPETRSEYAIPLKIEQRVVGVLDIQSDQENAFHETDQLVLQALADSIALAVEGAHLYRRIQNRAEQLQAVAEAGRAIASILDLDEMLNEVVTLLNKRFGYPFVHVFTVHPGRRKIIYEAGTGPRAEYMRASGLSYDLDDPQGMIPWVAREGQVRVANNVSEEPLYRHQAYPVSQETHSEAVVPLIYGGEVLGILDIQSDQPGVFSDDERFLFEALAGSIAVAMRNANLYRSEKWRRQVAESLRDVAGLLSTDAALEQVLDAILVELQRNLPSEVAAIWLVGDGAPVGFNAPKPDLQLAALSGGDPQVVQRVREITPGADSSLSQALSSGQPVVRSPQDPMGPLGTALGYPDDYSALIVPLRVGEQPLGVLALAHQTPGRYGIEARRMTAAFAGYASVAIENTRLYDSAQQQAWISTVLLQVAEATQSLTTTDELLETVVRLTPMLVGVKGCAIFTWDETAETFSLNSAYGLDPQHQAAFESGPIHPGQAVAFDEVRFGKDPVFIKDCAGDLGFSMEVDCEANQNVFLLIPLLSRSEILGALLVEHRGGAPDPDEPEESAAFDRQRLAILQGIARQTAVAVENIRLLEAKQDEAYVTAVLLQVAQAVASSNDLEEILGSIVQIMPILVGIDSSLIYLWDPDHERFRLAQAFSGPWTFDPDFENRNFSPGQYSLLDAVRRKDGLVILPIGDPPVPPDQWPRMRLPSGHSSSQDGIKAKGSLVLGFPLSIKGDVFGVMLAQESTSRIDLRERRVEIITGIAQQAALAIQNDRLNREMVERERLEREFQLAREIQQTFLPSHLPRLTGWDLDVRWRTARQVGGDFYDVFKLPGRRLGLVIADVSDKGMPAALYMTVTRTLIRAMVREESSPARVLKRVNDLLLMDSQYGMFVTAIYAVVSMASGEVTYANAGHNLPLVRRAASRRVETLEKGNTALAVFDSLDFENRRIRLEPGDVLVLYTDGITEAFSGDDHQFGIEQLHRVIHQADASSAHELGEAIDQALTHFTGEVSPSDDITLMVLRRAGEPTSSVKQPRENPAQHEDHRQANQRHRRRPAEDVDQAAVDKTAHQPAVVDQAQHHHQDEGE